MKRTVPVILGLGICAVAGLMTWQAYRRAQAAAESLRVAQAQQSQHTQAITQAKEHLEEVHRSNTLLSEHLRELATTGAPSRSKPSAPPQPNGIIENNPVLQNLQAAARRTQFEITYGPLYRKLGLTPAQIELFEQNVSRREQQQSDLFAASALDDRPFRENTAYQKLAMQADTDYQAAQQSLLGDAGVAQLREYERTVAARESVSASAATAAMAGLPLTAAQAEQLASVIASASTDYQKGGSTNMYSVDWSVVHERAKTFLSTSQLTFIETSEARGPRGAGSRFLPKLQAVIAAAAQKEPSGANP